MTMGEARDQRPELYGIGGWLGFLCLSLVLLTPMTALFRCAIMIFDQTADPVDKIVGVVFFAGMAGFAIVAGVALIQMWRSAVRIAKAYLFVNLVLGLLDTVVIAGTNDVGLIQSLYQNVAVTAWLGYLYRSERVRNTYAKNTVQDAAEVFR